MVYKGTKTIVTCIVHPISNGDIFYRGIGTLRLEDSGKLVFDRIATSADVVHPLHGRGKWI